jgi:hypothetical protein
MKNKTLSASVRVVAWMIGGAAIVAVFFFGTLFVLDSQTPETPDSIRVAHARSLKAALEKYRSAQGVYPSPFLDNPLTDLKRALVDGGYLRAIPRDPDLSAVDKQYRYVSRDGKTYGLLFHVQFPIGKIPAGGNCLTGVGTANTGWWGQPPDCPF